MFGHAFEGKQLSIQKSDQGWSIQGSCLEKLELEILSWGGVLNGGLSEPRGEQVPSTCLGGRKLACPPAGGPLSLQQTKPTGDPCPQATPGGASSLSDYSSEILLRMPSPRGPELDTQPVVSS